ncbi:MAG TPA: prolyl oligopeptidase family serine peptidase [Candidatus Acidoferrum sp.]|nr:prolyl oligopeptidase family serine peptidase [Candidatus Acidoferrum sp.]
MAPLIRRVSPWCGFGHAIRQRFTISALGLLFACSIPAATPKKPVTDDYFGTKIVDDYRWLEAGNDPVVQQWSDEQNAHARSYLDALPGRERLKQRLTELLTYQAPSWFDVIDRQGVLFAMKQQPPKAQPMLVVLGSLESLQGERVLLDPLVLDPSGETAMDFTVPSLDGKYVAVSLSRKGSEQGDVHVFEVASGRELKTEIVPAVNTGTAGGSLAWTKKGFFYTRHPLPGERPKEDLGFFQQVYFHKLGTPAKSDQYALGKGFIRIAENFLSTSRDGQWAADLVQKGDGGQYELFVRAPDGVWTKVANYADHIVQVHFGWDRALYLLSRKDAPNGQILRLALAPGKLTLARAKVIVPQGEGAIQQVMPTKSRLYVEEQLGGPSRIRMVDLAGRPLGQVPAPSASSLSNPEPVGEEDDVVVSTSEYLAPSGISRFTAKDGSLHATPYVGKTPADLSAYEVVREQCVSKDGTKVPLNIIRKKGLVLDGHNPVLLSGYGGFGISSAPGLSRSLPVWLEAGGVYAVANIRGGGEFGETWHQQGMLHNKQNVFDDFVACAQWLIDQKYTSPEKLAIEGGSNGGLLMGAVLTQAPGLFRAVVAHVGYFDMLRFETAPNGVFNTTEYGSVKNAADFKALAAYSPYLHVKDGTQYPAVLFLTGKNDPRVDPFHSRKMVARLQASGTKQPVLLRTADTGHGIGTPLAERIAQTVDTHAFLFQQLGMQVKSVQP